MKNRHKRKISAVLLITGGIIAGTLYLQYLYIYVPRVYRTKPLLGGLFLQFGAVSDRNYTFWEDEFRGLAEIGIDTVILQYVGISSQNTTYFPVSGFNNYVSAIGDDIVKVFLALGEKFGIDLWIGLLNEPDFGSYLANCSDLTSELLRNEEIVKALINYTASTAFAGWYIPYEISDGFGSEIRSKAFEFCSALIDIIKKYDKDRPIALSPYFGGVGAYFKERAYWENFVSEIKLDVLILQDGIGCGRTTIEEVARKFWIVSEVCRAHGIQFWANLELFKKTDKESAEYTPADWQVVEKMLKIEAAYADRIIGFDFPHYFSTGYSEAAISLYKNYTAYYTEYTSAII